MEIVLGQELVAGFCPSVKCPRMSMKNRDQALHSLLCITCIEGPLIAYSYIDNYPPVLLVRNSLM